MAMENENIKAYTYEASEFPDVSMRYSVMAVPKTVINETTSVEGAVPEAALLQQLKESIA